MANNIPGIYAIVCTVNNKIYIGGAKNISRRWRDHRSELNRGHHGNGYLQSAWEKHGSESFSFVIIEEVYDLDMLVSREQYWVDYYDSRNKKYRFNLRVVVESNFGIEHSIESRANMAAGCRERKKHSAETRMKIAAANRGKKLSPEHVAKVAAALRGRKNSPEAIVKMSLAKRGKKQSPEHIAKRLETRFMKKN
jgi:group I intron endonuclease